MPRGRNVQEPPSRCEFVLPEAGTMTECLSITLHLEDSIYVGSLELSGDYGHYVFYLRFPFPMSSLMLLQKLHILI